MPDNTRSQGRVLVVVGSIRVTLEHKQSTFHFKLQPSIIFTLKTLAFFELLHNKCISNIGHRLCTKNVLCLLDRVENERILKVDNFDGLLTSDCRLICIFSPGFVSGRAHETSVRRYNPGNKSEGRQRKNTFFPILCFWLYKNTVV